MARSGSMWSFNVTRELFRAAGYRVLPERVPRRKDKDAVTEQALSDNDVDAIWVLKTHEIVQRDLPQCRFICTHRDLRDALVSFKNFMQCSFDNAVQAMISAARVSDCYRELGGDRVLHLDYTDIIRHPDEIVRRIGAFCSIDPGNAARADIVTRFSKANVRRLIAETETDIVARLRANSDVDNDEIVSLVNGRTRVMDLATGFQGGHVTDYRDGDWRQILTAEQRRLVQATFGDWLARNGYPEE